MPAAPYALLSTIRTFRVRWLNREVSQVPLYDFRRSTGLTARKVCSNRAEKGPKRWIRAISARFGALPRLGGRRTVLTEQNGHVL